VVDLSVHRYGPGAPTVLLLHGLSSAGSVWWRIGAALASAGYGSLAPDLRGHGGTTHSDRYDFDSYAGDVLASCTGPWRLVVGHSLGGAVAVRAATIDPTFSEAYLLVDPAIDFDPAAAKTVHSSIIAEVGDPPGVEQLLADHPHWDHTDAELKYEALRATSVDVIERTFIHNHQWELGRDLAAIAAPVHILGAADEPLYTASQFDRHGAENQAMTFEIVPGAGHSIHRDAPETVVARALWLLQG
jgi:pimeloyl-ACP methyl ester carboxylesterase